MSIFDSYRDILYGGDPDGRDRDTDLTKPCTVEGCAGTMHCRPRLAEWGGPETLEWPWLPTWVCRANGAHFEIASDEDEKAALDERRRNGRLRPHDAL